MISGTAIVGCLKSFEYKPIGGVVVYQRQRKRNFVKIRTKSVTKFIKNTFNNASRIIESQSCIIASHIKAWTSDFYKNSYISFNTKGFTIFFGGAFLRLREVD